ncbi:DUF1772 domain-containing protein [Gloeobacter violaceus]|uniref:Glr0483 protein n=1 Tax=Gloeobacter violaceus (strain ATCC 29082 / PCC 7421) TaxID=251221 RepID=Q7NNC8_GLOVI|nr:DUF1772 domain-containing protein [Gloeobacter violaceus]BAC88424.1 glr0483 [Gloeobacter violaceus PCC 7421]
MNDPLPTALWLVSVLSTAVLYGTDVFFAVVGRDALAKSSTACLADVVARLHEVADERMPVFGATALASTFAFGLSLGLPTASGLLVLVTLAALLSQLGLYLAVARPVNRRMVQAVQTGQALPDARALQARWDSVIVARALSLTLALVTLLAAGVLR